MDARMRRWTDSAQRTLGAKRKAVAAVLTTGALAVGGIYPVELVLNATGGNQFLSAPALAQPPTTATAPLASSVPTSSESAASSILAAASAVQDGVTAATANVQQTFAPSPAHDFKVVTDDVRQAFFSSKIPFGSIIVREAKKNDLAPELVAAVIQQESRFNPSARSGGGALGLMQLVPRTGRRMGAQNLLNPEQNIAAGARYLRYLSDEFGGNERNVIAAYNAGEGNVRKFGGLPPFRQTRNYVQKVLQSRSEFAKKVATEAAVQSDGQPGL